MEKIILNSQTVNSILDRINSFTKESYHSIQLGYSDNDLSPDNEEIRWKEEIYTNYNTVAYTDGYNIFLSRNPAKSTFIFEEKKSFFVSEDEIIFQSALSPLRYVDCYLYIRIKTECNQAEEKFFRYVKNCQLENEKILDFPETECIMYELELDEDDFDLFYDDEDEIEALSLSYP